MVTQEELEKLIEAYPHRYTMHDLAELYKIKKTEDFIALNKLVNRLEEELKIARDDQNRYALPAQCGLYVGKLTVNRRGFGFLDLDEEHSIFIPKTAMNQAMDGDRVLVKTDGTLNENPEGEVLRILEHGRHFVIGTWRQKKRLIFVLDDERISSFVKVQNERDFWPTEGLKARCEIVRYGDPLIVKVERILGHEMDPGVDVAAVLLDHGIESEFPDAVMKQLKGIPDHVVASDWSGRQDLRQEVTVTIDGEDSKDFDDAISLKTTAQGWQLGVHIADVCWYVAAGSPLDQEARKRGTSTYVADRVVPMLPHALSNGICSLNEGVDRLTISCMMEINHQGEVLDYQIFPSVIRSRARMTYSQVNRILEGNLEMIRRFRSLSELFHQMHDCALSLRLRRSAAGAIDFDKKEAKIHVNEQGKVLEVTVRERGEAERMIEDFMVTANVVVAQHLHALEVPALYRIHEAPDLKKMRDLARMTAILGYPLKGDLNRIHPLQLQQCLTAFQDQESYPVVSTMMLRSMQKARYDFRCAGHFGLALPEYTHFTSPIRRYPDLIVHRQLRRYCFLGQVDPTRQQQEKELMEQLGEETSVCERRSIEAERDVEDMKKAEFMHGKLGQRFVGVISGVTKFGFYVELPNTIEGLVHLQDLNDDYYNLDPGILALRGERSGRCFKLGQKVQVRLIRASKEKREIDFVLAEPKKKIQAKRPIYKRRREKQC